MDSPVEHALNFVRSLAALGEQLAKRDIVVRRLDCNWSAFGSWTIEASSGDSEAKRSLAIRIQAFTAPGPDVLRVTWDGKEHQVKLASTPTTVISMLNRWRVLEGQRCDSHKAAVALAYNWLADRLGSS